MSIKYLSMAVLSCGLVIALAAPRAVVAVPQDKSADQQLVKLTQDFAGYELRSDTAALNSMLSDDFTFTHASGMVQPKVAYLNTLKNGTRRYEKFDLVNVEVSFYGTTAIAKGHLHIRNVNAGQPPHDFMNQYTLVWIKQGGEWRMVALQLTPIGEIKIGTLRNSESIYNTV